MNDRSERLIVDIAGVRISPPVMAASGTFGYGDEHRGLCDLTTLGAIVTKGISLLPRDGNPPPRIHEMPCGLLNSIGLQNIGVRAFLRDKLEFLKAVPCACIVNILGDSVEDYAELAAELDGADGIDMLEVNISCPNVKKGGHSFGIEPRTAAEVTKAVKSATSLPVMVKLTPAAGSAITEVAVAVQDAGADAVSLINTLPAMEIDVDAKKPVLGNVTGGLSGPAVRPVALKMVRDVAAKVRVPVVGMGGITGSRDVIAFLLAGASCVQVGTGLLVDPDLPGTILAGLLEYMDRHGIRHVTELTGALEP